MGEDSVLYEQLEMLSHLKSEENLEEIILTLWKTRKTGLTTPQKTHFQSLLNLPSIAQLHPVLACLRSLIRKCSRENLSEDDILKMFPPDLSLDLKSNLITIFQKNQTQWMEEMSGDQHLFPQTNLSNQVSVVLLPPSISLPSSEMTAFLWPKQDDPIANFNSNAVGTSKSNITENNFACLAPVSLQQDVNLPLNLETLPRLKSMTWTLENQNKKLANQVAIITLKLQDPKPPLGETEVKFQLTRDTFEAMLRSLSYINEQLTNFVGSSSAVYKRNRDRHSNTQ